MLTLVFETMNRLSQFMEAVWLHKNYVKQPSYYEALVPKSLLKSESGSIPKSFHQTNYTKNLKPEVASSIQSMLDANLGWVHNLYDDDDIKAFILRYYGDLLWNYYERIDPFYGAARADFFRYLLIYQLGGVYLDIKTTVKGNLNELLSQEDEFLLSFWDNEPGDLHEGQTFVPELDHISRGEYVQWCIIARPRHPLLRAVILRVLEKIDSYNPYKDGMGFMGTIRTTGPAPYTLAIEEAIARGEIGYRWVSFAKDLSIQYSIYEGEGKSLAHKGILKSNYHLGKCPVIRHRSRLVQSITVLYMKVLRWYRECWIKK